MFFITWINIKSVNFINYSKASLKVSSFVLGVLGLFAVDNTTDKGDKSNSSSDDEWSL